MSKRKIAVICDVKNWGGWERASKIKEHLSDEFEIDLFDQQEFDTYEQQSDPYFVHMDEVHAVAQRQAKFFTRKTVCIPELIKYKKAKNKIKSRDYDLYYLMFHTMLCSQQVKRMIYGGCKFASAVTGMPVIKEVFSNEKYAENGRKAFNYLAKVSVGFVANNNISLAELREKYDGPTFYTPRGVDPDLFKPEPEPEEIAASKWRQNPFQAIFVGKEGSGKGLKFLRNVCSQAGVRLLENQRNYTNALTKKQMCDFYNEGHVLLVSSSTDGTPNPALEAAACGIPVMANRIGNMPEFIKDGVNGFFIDKKGAAAYQAEYINKLIWLRKNRDKAKEMGMNARQTVLDGWTWKHSMEYERKAIRGLLEAIK